MNLTRRRWASGIAVAALGCSKSEAPEPGRAGEPGPPHVIDLHCDTPMLFRDGSFDLGVRNDRGEVDIPRMRAGSVTAVFFSVYTSATRNTELEAVQEALEIIDSIRRTVELHPDDLVFAVSAEEIRAARDSGRIAILLGIEGGHMINSSLAVLRSLYALGGRYLTLTHSKETPWAGSSGSDSDTGLTDFGREVVAEMNRLGMMVDISHVSDRTFWDVVESSQAPIIASHSSARALASHRRNMTDEMIRATADTGGVVHINYYNTFLDDNYVQRSRQWEAENPDTGKSGGRDARTKAKLAAIGRTSLETLLDHFEHAVRIGGIEAVGMGSDFDGVDGELPEGVEDIAMIPNIAAGLVRRGFSSGDVERILGTNSLRVLQDVETAAASRAQG